MKRKRNKPDGTHQTVDKELVFFRRGLLPGVPDFAVAALHKPPLEIDGMPDEWVRNEFVGWEREGLECRVEIGDAVLDEQADEVQASDGEFTLGAREDGTVHIGRYEQRTK
jgi:hypothetical protein